MRCTTYVRVPSPIFPQSVLLLLGSLCLASAGQWRASNRHVATDNQMVMREDDGGVK